MTKPIGFLGLGQMGAAMACRLEADDVRLHLHDPDPGRMRPFVERGGVACRSVGEIARATSIVFTCLPTPDVAIEVANALAAADFAGIHIEMSTIGRRAIEQVERIHATAGARVIDAPVSGGPDAAAAGTLSIMAAGEDAALAVARPWLRRIAGTLFEVGASPGAAQVMKLVNNLTAASLIALTTEAMAIGAATGLEPGVMATVLDASSGRNSVTNGLLPDQVLTGRFAFGASIATMTKDVDLALAEAESLGVPAPLAEEVARQWHAACVRLGDHRDLTHFMDALAPAGGGSP